MSGSLREFLPRQELKKNDRLPSYPTIARTGDKGRLGNNNVFFDDSNTVIFKETAAIVSYPSTLEIANRYLSSDMTSSITSSNGKVDKNAIDNFVVLTRQQESFTPFNESKLYEQNYKNSENFFLTGTDVSIAGIGFNSSLLSKTAIRLEFPIINDTIMHITAACVYYFNPKLGRFEEVGTTRRTTSSNFYPMNDVMLFDSFGNNTFGNFINNPFWRGPTNIGSILHSALTLEPNNIEIPPVLADSEFSPTSSCYIDMKKYINKPFLIEKAVLEVPLKAGPGWFNDRTKYKSITDSTYYPAPLDDAGGPCVTFSLQNIFPDRRDLILSATCIPSGDNIISFETASVSDVANYAGGGTIYLRSTFGFTTTGTPSCVVTPKIDNTFTGTTYMQAIPGISNGILANKDIARLASPSTFADSFLTLVNTFGRSSNPMQPSGRSYFGKEYVMPQSTPPTSRTRKLFGNPVAPVYDYPDAFFHQNNSDSPYLIFPEDQLLFCASKYRAINQYLGSSSVGPTLQHDISLTTGSIFITLYGSQISNECEYHDTLNQRLETSEIHEAIGTEFPPLDKFNVEYYQTFTGSYVSQQLTGSIIRSTSRPGIYTASNRYIWAESANTSSFQENLEIIETSRAVIFTTSHGAFTGVDSPANYSDINTLKKEKFGITRFAPVFSNNERFFDSMTPAIDEIIEKDSSWLVGLQFVYSPGVNQEPIGDPIISLTFDVNLNDTVYQGDLIKLNSDVDWTKSYPYESKYSSLSRKIDNTNIIYKKALTYGVGFASIGNPSSPLPGAPPKIAKKILVNGGVYWRWGGDCTAFFSHYSLTLRKDAITKLVYGFGDLNTYPNDTLLTNYGTVCTSTMPSVTNKLFGCTNFPSPRRLLNYGGINSVAANTISACRSANIYHGVAIRGWKYGIINAFPQYSKAIFNFNHYGQPRDMLEQRLDTKFYESMGYKLDGSLGGNTGILTAPVQVRFVNYKGEVTKPEYTMSSNLSYECTSSLPYFDGVVRNREEPINISSIGLTSVL